LTMIVGGWQMLQQQSIKRILAFSSVSQMGYVLMGLAVGTPLALAAAAMHLIHHALVKTALFMAAGMLAWRAGVHNLPETGGLGLRLPFSLAIFSLAGLSLSGLPFLSGFVSKTMLEEAALEARLPWIAAAAIAASALTLAGMTRLIWRVFGPSRRGAAPPHAVTQDAPALALLPMGILVAGSLAVGLAPQWTAARLAWPAARSLAAPSLYVASVLDPAALSGIPPAEVHIEDAPVSTDWHHWPVPAVVALLGSTLAFGLVRRPVHAANSLLRPLRSLSGALRRWHSGDVGDYALWTAVGTTVMMLILVGLARP